MSVVDEIILGFSPSVYEPAEDSELLAEAVASDAGVRGVVLDVGTGSGLQAIVAARKRGVARVVATDVNPEALKLASENAAANGVAGKIVFIESDLFERVPHKKFDCVVFNPPYLPTAKKEKVRGTLNAAFDGGGAKGRRVTDRFLRGVKRFLAPNGVLLLVQSSLSDYRATIGFLERAGFRTRVAASRRFFFEEIVVLRGVLKTRAR
ncbi:MAG: HemK2/MTQ2 family protein methyltransferase [Candidatus Micrarchaeota archaeon]